MFGEPIGSELPILGDHVVTLEPFSRRDIPAMMAWDADAEAQRWFDWPTELPDPAAHEAHCIDVIAGWRTDSTAGRRAPFAIRRSARGETVGSVELRFDDDMWYISYLTHPDWRGRGFATRAVRLVCEWAFTVLDIDGIGLVVAEDNGASRAVARHVGFVETGRRTTSPPVDNYQPDVGSTRTMVEYVLGRSGQHGSRVSRAGR